MKKFLVLALVLSMATMANAAIVWQASATEVHPSDVITINVITTAGEHVIGLEIDATTDGGAGGYAATPLTLNSNFGGFADVGALVNASGILTQYTFGNSGVGAYATGTLFSYMYHVPSVPASTTITIGDTWRNGSDSTEIDFYDGSSTYTHLTGATIHVIPEPMTMGLLGLGGLFLRRRSK
jgi:hypothetical protein